MWAVAVDRTWLDARMTPSRPWTAPAVHLLRSVLEAEVGIKSCSIYEDSYSGPSGCE